MPVEDYLDSLAWEDPPDLGGTILYEEEEVRLWLPFQFRQSMCSCVDRHRRQIPKKWFSVWMMGVFWFCVFSILCLFFIE